MISTAKLILKFNSGVQLRSFLVIKDLLVIGNSIDLFLINRFCQRLIEVIVLLNCKIPILLVCSLQVVKIFSFLWLFLLDAFVLFLILFFQFLVGFDIKEDCNSKENGEDDKDPYNEAFVALSVRVRIENMTFHSGSIFNRNVLVDTHNYEVLVIVEGGVEIS